MLIPRTVFIIAFICNGVLAQSQDGSVYLTIEGNKAVNTRDTLTCDEYYKLKRDLNLFNRNALKSARRYTDSLSKVEFPCYEFEVIFEGISGWENKILVEDGCPVYEITSDILYAKHIIVIYRKRRFKIMSNGESKVTFCNDEIVR